MLLEIKSHLPNPQHKDWIQETNEGLFSTLWKLLWPICELLPRLDDGKQGRGRNCSASGHQSKRAIKEMLMSLITWDWPKEAVEANSSLKTKPGFIIVTSRIHSTGDGIVEQDQGGFTSPNLAQPEDHRGWKRSETESNHP